MMQRRELLSTALTVGAASVLNAETVLTGEERQRSPIIDTNVSLFRWPFRRLPLDETQTLVQKLRALGVQEAWAGSFEGVLHRDITGVNQRLSQACRFHPQLVPIGSINLELPDWQHDLQQCIETHRMPGVRLHPNYHGYTLDDPRFSQLLQRTAAAGVFVQLAVAMEDIRTQHPLVQVADVDLGPLPKVVAEIPGVTVQILNHRLRGPLLNTLAQASGILFDTSRVDSTDGVAQMLSSVSSKRVMLGSHAPFLIPEAALIRTYESNLSEDDLQAVTWATARQLRKGRDR